MKGTIFEIERWSLSDGPGTRTVVFLKGCPLKCLWCSNPESQSARPQIGIFTAKCIECRKCEDACPEGTARPALQGGFAPESPCTVCGECVDACPARSRRWMGEEKTAAEIVDIIQKDMVFYRKSAGGVTFSGGEPLAQPEFLNQIIQGCRKIGIHTAVESCGAFNWKNAEETVSLLDFVMFDIKHMDPERHRALTGSSNKIILDNARRISATGVPMLIRIPVIPALNDSDANIAATIEFVKASLPSAVGIEPLPYHKLGLTKYAALGKEYTLNDLPELAPDTMDKIRTMIASKGVACITSDTDLTVEPACKAVNL